MSATELARLAGIGKATLSALEAGTGNPTVETLDAIALALRIPVTDLLLAEQSSEPEIRRIQKNTDVAPSQQLLHRLGVGRSVEIWHLSLPPNSHLEGVPHSPGTVEHILVNKGTVDAGPTSDLRTLKAGDFLLFSADSPHKYVSKKHAVEATVIMASPLAP